MKRIFRKISEFFLEEQFCPHCKQYVKVKTTVIHRGRQKIEIRKCIRCGKVVEETIHR